MTPLAPHLPLDNHNPNGSECQCYRDGLSHSAMVARVKDFSWQ